MTTQTHPYVRIPFAIAAIASLVIATGCCTKRPAAKPRPGTGEVSAPGGLDTDVIQDDRGKIDPYVRYSPPAVPDPMDPSPTSGSINIPPGSFGSGNNNQICFPAANGWDRYYTTFYFLGPNTTPPNPNNYPNPDNNPILEVTTNDPANGTSLVAGVVIIDNLNPNSKVCSPTTPGSPNLGTAIFNPMGSGRRYRATVFYKSSTMPAGMTNVVMRWTYHN